jgi:hypothetical protein
MELGFLCWRRLATLVNPTCSITGLALGFVPTMGSFTRLRANDVKLWSHIAFPGFSSLQVLLLLTTQWLVRALVKYLAGSPVRPFNFTPLHSLTGPVGQLSASHLGGQRFASWGCTNSQWNRVSHVSDVSLNHVSWFYRIIYGAHFYCSVLTRFFCELHRA